jgi:hypothetical protein
MATVYLQMLAVTSPTSGGLSVGILRLQTQATEFFSLYWSHIDKNIAFKYTTNK